MVRTLDYGTNTKLGIIEGIRDQSMFKSLKFYHFI